ncbi:uncharacterized protein LOC127865139 [Dreissena polymorpha]|uniref:uncharacterized protein LOC127865139 n=1 Tax=Dreissena polymorpha TaxID=45954 RepID=UPI002263C6B6|nr:uncharacterized protein LOC127865139 [Dreissena polymorpha]
MSPLEPRYFREGIITLPIGIVCIVNVILFYVLMIRALRGHATKMARKKNVFNNTVTPQLSGSNEKRIGTVNNIVVQQYSIFPGGNEVGTQTSYIDVFEYDGTVNKNVMIDYPVVGAVCVMNPTNKLAGRRNIEMRAAKRIAVLIGSFAVLWLPLPMATMLLSNTALMSENDMIVLALTGAVSSLTVAVNPVLNLLLNKQLRSSLFDLLSLTSLGNRLVQPYKI